MITTPITTSEIRKTPSQITTVINRTTTTSSSISSDKPTTGPWGFSLKLPFTSFFSGNRNRHDALAVDDAVSVEETSEEQIQRVRNRLEDEFVQEDEQGCDACTVDDDEIEFDKSSFSKLLRRVSLTEARLYCQMSYLGSLAYSIQEIKVNCFCFVGVDEVFDEMFQRDFMFCLDLGVFYALLCTLVS